MDASLGATQFIAYQCNTKVHFYLKHNTFDYLVRLVRDGQCGLAEAIKRIREADQDPNPENGTFLFRYSLNTHFGNGYMQMPKYLEDELEEVLKTVKQKLPM